MAPFTASPAVANAAGVVNRIHAKLPDMPAAMAKIGTFLLEHPHAPLELSIMELASETKTSAATVTRFCRLLGYSGYVPFRVSIASDVGRTDARESWKSDIGRAFGPDDSAGDVLSTLVNAHTRSLEETAAVMAKELQSRLYRIGINAHHWSEVHAGLTSAAIQDSNSVAIGISNTGRTEETIQMLREAGEAGALTVALSNNPGSPLAESADEAIITSVHEQFLQPDDLSAKHVQLLVLDMIYLLVAQMNFTQTAAKLAASAAAVSPHRRPTRAARLELGARRGQRNDRRSRNHA